MLKSGALRYSCIRIRIIRWCAPNRPLVVWPTGPKQPTPQLHLHACSLLRGGARMEMAQSGSICIFGSKAFSPEFKVCESFDLKIGPGSNFYADGFDFYAAHLHVSIDLHASIPSRTRLVSYAHGFSSYVRDFPIYGHGIFSYAVGCSPYAWLILMRTWFFLAPPFPPQPGFPYAHLLQPAPLLPPAFLICLSNKTEHSIYQNAT